MNLDFSSADFRSFREAVLVCSKRVDFGGAAFGTRVVVLICDREWVNIESGAVSKAFVPWVSSLVENNGPQAIIPLRPVMESKDRSSQLRVVRSDLEIQFIIVA